MKALFLLVCIICALSLCYVSYIMATGNIPGRPKEQTIVEKEAKKVEAETKGTALAGQNEEVERLITALKTEKAKYEKKLGELTSKEQAMATENEAMKSLIQTLEENRKLLDSKIVETEASEQVNLKRLAVVYSKMDPESASTLLREMTDDRAARILDMIPERQAAAILNSAIATGPPGAKRAAGWSDVIRRMKQEKAKKGP